MAETWHTHDKNMAEHVFLNMAEHGFKVSVCNRSPAKIDTTVARAKAEGNLPLEGHKDIKEFVASLSVPRKIVILVMAGKPVDDTIALLAAHMEEGDVTEEGALLKYTSMMFASPACLNASFRQTG